MPEKLLMRLVSRYPNYPYWSSTSHYHFHHQREFLIQHSCYRNLPSLRTNCSCLSWASKLGELYLRGLGWNLQHCTRIEPVHWVLRKLKQYFTIYFIIIVWECWCTKLNLHQDSQTMLLLRVSIIPHWSILKIFVF